MRVKNDDIIIKLLKAFFIKVKEMKSESPRANVAKLFGLFVLFFASLTDALQPLSFFWQTNEM